MLVGMHFCIIYIAMQPWSSWRPLKFELPKFKVIQMKNRPFLNEKFGNHILQDKVQIIIPMSYYIILSEYFLTPTPTPTPTSLVIKKKKEKKDCLFFKLLFIFSKLYIPARELWGHNLKIVSCSPTQLELDLTYGSEDMWCSYKGNFRNISYLGHYSHEL